MTDTPDSSSAAQHRAGYIIEAENAAEMARLMLQNMLVFFKLFQPFLIRMQVATQEKLQQLYDQMEEEILAEDFCGIDYFLAVWGHKGDAPA